jgi:uncharacterized protein HemX
MMNEDLIRRGHARIVDAGRPAGRGAVTLALALALGTLLLGGWTCVNRTHQRRRQARAAALPKPLQTWEGEGGRADMLSARR